VSGAGSWVLAPRARTRGRKAMFLFGKKKEESPKKGPSLLGKGGAPAPIVYRERSEENFQQEELNRLHDGGRQYRERVVAQETHHAFHDETRRSDAGPTPRAAAARVRAALYYLAAAALVAECLVPAACVDFPPGCNDALEDYLDEEELWDNAFQYGTKGMFDEARTCFEVYVCNQPTSERAWHLLAEVHGRMGNPEGALRHAQVAARIGGENASAAEGHFLLANAYMQVLEYGKARQSYYRAIRLDENHVNSMVNLGVVLGNNNDYAEAIPIYRRALKVQPDLMAARHNLGSALHTLKVFHEALSVLEPLVADEPDCYECWLSLGHTLSEVKQLARATACYKKGMDIRPHDPDALLNYFFTKQQVIDWEERDELFQRLKKVTEAQLAQRHLTTVGPYYSLLSPFEQEQMLGIAESHAIKAYDKIKFRLPYMPDTFGAELQTPIFRSKALHSTPYSLHPKPPHPKP
jgi:tetratricopeptide (TPR) repeat protein